MPERLTRTLASRLREERRRAGLSLRALAGRSGLSTTTVHQIEIGRGSPSLATLHALAATLGVALPSLLGPSPAQAARASGRQASGEKAVRAAHGAIGPVAEGLPGQRLHGLVLTLAPGATTGPGPMVHPGQELVFGLSGRCVYEVAGEEHPIEPGDSLVLDSQRPHRARNPGRRPARLLLVLYVPAGARRPPPPPRRPRPAADPGAPGAATVDAARRGPPRR